MGSNTRWAKERGQTLLLACCALILLLAMAAMSIDFSMMYVARNEAQRAADAAALAGATVFRDSGCTSAPGTAGSCTSAAVQTAVKAQAKGTGSQNKVFGQAASIADADITFPVSPSPSDPLVQVTVRRNLPTVFAGALKSMLGGAKTPVAVAATATAEAFNPTGTNTPVQTSCIKPWLISNCDPYASHPGTGNLCNNGATLVNSDNSITNPGPFSTGVIGEHLMLHENSGPSQYGEISFDGVPGDYKNYIPVCETQAYKCGDKVPVIPGGKVGQTNHGLDTLINAPGQDTLVDAGGNPVSDADTNPGATPPLTIQAGSNNPLVQAGVITQGTVIPPAESSSVVTVPIYNGANLNPGNGQTETVVGFLQMFVQSHTGGGNKDHVNAIVLNTIACPAGGGGGAGGGPPVGGTGGNPIPVRLVRNP